MLSRVVGTVPGAATAGLRRFSSSPAAAAKVGFIGLGNMGKHMAVNLVKAGHTLSVFDLAEGPVSELVSAGAAKADSAAAAVEGADAVVTMLPSSPHVKDVYLSSVFPAAAEGTLCIDCSTIDPNTTRELAGAAQEAKVRMVDAPVSGGVGGAEAGTLTFMVGGSEVDFASASELLVSMGKNLVHCGGAGNGQ
ncbi:hibA, partial [Symbiodinium sp. KB8]